MVFFLFIFHVTVLGRIRCRTLLHPPTNGYFVGVCRRKIGTICTFACNPGFKLYGSQQVICETNGQWSSPEPTCLPLTTCPQLPVPIFGARNGECHKDSPINSICFFSCSDGFTLEGSKTLLCTASGQWNASVPICKRNPTPAPKPSRIRCPALTPILYGTQTGFCSPGYPGKECVFNCSEGYYLVGNPVLKCGYEGQWTSAAPSCLRKIWSLSMSYYNFFFLKSNLGGEGCIPPIPGKGVVITTCKSFLGGKCYYICINDGGILSSFYNYTALNQFARSFSFDFEKSNERYTVCGPDGQWQSKMGCKKIKLPKFPLLSLLGK